MACGLPAHSMSYCVWPSSHRVIKRPAEDVNKPAGCIMECLPRGGGGGGGVQTKQKQIPASILDQLRTKPWGLRTAYFKSQLPLPRSLAFLGQMILNSFNCLAERMLREREARSQLEIPISLASQAGQSSASS